MILDLAKKVIQIEALSLNHIADSLNENFTIAIENLNQTSGRIIVTGLGKSAIVGRKIAATLNSTGTPSYFLHSGDALHGDIGMITKDDAIIVLSKSGESEELKTILPHIKRIGGFILAIVGNGQSFLAKIAHHAIVTPIEKEADPNNLAPTASSTVQMAVGDAIALCLQQLKGFAPSDFAKLHPGGSLGNQLLLEVRDILDPQTTDKNITENSPIRDVIVEITKNRLGACVVYSENWSVTGIITDGDLRRMLQSHPEPFQLVAGDIMTHNPMGIPGTTLAKEALIRMNNRKITQLLVFSEHDEFMGILHIHNLLGLGLQ